MRVELTIGGADQVKAAFRSLSDELDKLNKKLDATAGKLSAAGQAAGGGGGITSSNISVSSVASSPVVKPPIVSPPVISGAGSGIASAIAGIPGPAKLAAAALAAVASAAMQASKAITEYAQYAFIARGSSADKGAVAGISRAAGVGIDEAGQLAGSKPGGSRQLKYEIDQLRNMKDDDMAAKYAQNRGIEGYRSVRNMTEGQYQRAMNAPQITGAGQRVNDRATTEFNSALSQLSVTVQKALMPVIVDMTVKFVSFVKVVEFIIAPLSDLGDLITSFVDKLTGGNHEDASQKQLDAAKMNKDSANKISDAVYGGGNRTRGAIPAAWGWYPNQAHVQREIRNLGSI